MQCDIGTDLTFEGIATEKQFSHIVSPSLSIGTDLTFEGIATQTKGRFTNGQKNRNRPDIRRDCDFPRILSFFPILHIHRNRPDIRRDCDAVCPGLMLRRVLVIGTDLTFEGIATRADQRDILWIDVIGTDLTFEGIATD